MNKLFRFDKLLHWVSYLMQLCHGFKVTKLKVLVGTKLSKEIWSQYSYMVA